MDKLIISDNADYFVKIIQPKIDRMKVQDPFDDYQYKTLNYYNKKVWDVMKIPIQNTESERSARSRAFSTAKYKIFFNSDLKYFITLTYKENMQDYDQLKTDMKVFFNSEKRKGKEPKYLWVVEKQKRGALHVHMICNDFFTVKKNKYGKLTIPTWKNGFTNIEEIKIRDSSEADVNFKPFLYMYKYMNKSQKIGGRYVHSSRNLSNYTELTDFKFNKSTKTKLFTEHTTMGSLDRHLIRHYYQDTN